ncbi:MAG: uroporphyrinogen-III synthase [Archaeoglobaceae archaeon]
MKVAVLRPQEYIQQTLELFPADVEVVPTPFLRININEEGIDELRNLDHFDVAIVTSQTAARILLSYSYILKDKRVIAIGKKTAEVLSQYGIEAEIPQKFDSQTVYNQYKSELKDLRVILLRSNRGDPVLLKLNDVARVEEVVLYTIEKEWGEKQKELLNMVKRKEIDAVIFSSSMMVKSFMGLAEEMGILQELLEYLNQIWVIAIGPPTANMLKEYGVESKMPDEYTFNGIIKLLSSLKGEQKK